MAEQGVTPWLASMIKLKGTPEQRKARYAKARELGATPSLAKAMRDWRSPKPFRAFGIEVPSLRERRTMGLLVLGCGLLIAGAIKKQHESLITETVV